MRVALLTLILSTGALALAVGAAPSASTADCASSVLRGGASLQGATGSQLGGLIARNRGPAVCLLVGPPRVIRVAGKRLLALEELRRPTHEQRLLLRPGDGAGAELQLFNACPPNGDTGTLSATFNGGRTRVSLHIPPGGRCDLPTRPPMYSVGAMQRINRTRR